MENQRKVLVFFANGMEEMEAIILVDVLRRGQVEVVTVSDGSSAYCRSGHPIQPENLILASRNTWHLADRSLESFSDEDLLDFDMVLFPGGLKGAEFWNSHPRTPGILSKFQSHSKWIGAICAAPRILLEHGILKEGDRYTAYPNATHEGKDYTGAPVEILSKKKVVTAKGPGSAFRMALEILEILKSRSIREEVEKSLQFS